MSKHKCFQQEKPLYTLKSLEEFKAVLGIDDREDTLARYCLLTSTYSIEQYCKRWFLRKKYFVFTEYGKDIRYNAPLKIFMATNHKPVIKGTDHGIWRRIKLIPFLTRIEDEKQDKHLDQKLMQEGPGVLNWLIEGAKGWYGEGLKTPNIIIRATDEYRAEMDVIGNFLKERCEMKQDVSVKARELFKCYQDWCDDHNEHAVSERFLGLRLKELGLGQKRSQDGRHWQGLALRAN